MTNESNPIASMSRVVFHLVVHFFAAAFVLLVICPIAGGYIEFYERTEALLPVATQWIVEVSLFMSAYWFLVLPFFAIIDGSVVLVIGLSKRHHLLAYWTVTILVLTIILLTFVQLSLYLPLHELPATASAVH